MTSLTFGFLSALQTGACRVPSALRHVVLGVVAAGALAAPAQAAVGLSEIAATPQDGPITLYYPTDSQAAALRRGPFTLNMAEQGVPVRGNGRLVVLSHGTGGSPLVHADLASTLVQAGFVVAMPEHRGDNH